ncbi:MAG: M23 family metallopeptidase [Synergistaceae bacterium]|jgi:murein DD-endopeptidase MepM/ murein hydrolase activator NlpD|nr:M23 family metallopeptidase [Synergistaceae bacterium]
MTNLHESRNLSSLKSNGSKKFFRLSAVLSAVMVLMATRCAFAAVNIDSPRDALDIAWITPGKYFFSGGRAELIGHAEATVLSIKGIADLMKQAIETAAMLPVDGRPETVLIPKPLSNIDGAIKTASALPVDAKISRPLSNIDGAVKTASALPVDAKISRPLSNIDGAIKTASALPVDAKISRPLSNIDGAIKTESALPVDAKISRPLRNIDGAVKTASALPIDAKISRPLSNIDGAVKTASALPVDAKISRPLSNIDIAIKIVSTLPIDVKISKPSVKPVTKDKVAEKKPVKPTKKDKVVEKQPVKSAKKDKVVEKKSKPAQALKSAVKKPVRNEKKLLLAGKMSVAGEVGPNGLQWPVEGFIYSTFNSPRGRTRRHGAIDIVTKRGTPIAAAADGAVSMVASSGKGFGGYGRVVIIKHNDGVHTLYSHCDTIIVKMGQRVKRGEFIGTVGRTGRATTDHLHFEVRIAGAKKDPLRFLPSRPEMVKATNYKSSKKKRN